MIKKSSKLLLFFYIYFLVPNMALAHRYGICEDGANCGGGAINGIFGIFLIIVFLGFLGIKRAAIYLFIWLAPAFIANSMGEKLFAALWLLLGFYLSFIITAWIIDFIENVAGGNAKNIIVENNVNELINSDKIINNKSIINYKKESYLIIINQWGGGPYWARAFPAEDVVKILRSRNVNEVNKNKIADIINNFGDYKFNLIDQLMDSNVEVIADAIDKSRVKAIRAARVQANEKGWKIILSEFDIVTRV